MLTEYVGEVVLINTTVKKPYNLVIVSLDLCGFYISAVGLHGKVLRVRVDRLQRCLLWENRIE